MKYVIVTRHKALVTVLRELYPQLKDAEVLEQVTAPEQIDGAMVFGDLPLRLAALTCAVVEVPLHLSPADQGRELTEDEVRARMGRLAVYEVIGGDLEV
jgi:hypothetical protein